MKKIINTLIFFIIVFLLITNSYEIMDGIKFAFNICINNLFPSLIPFMILSNILIEYNFFNDLNFNLINKLFKLNNNTNFIFIMSILSGTPSNAKYIKDMLDKNLININEAKKCLSFCHFVNPIFIIGTVGLNYLNSKKLGLIILISHYLSALIIALFNRKKYEYVEATIKVNKSKTNFINVLIKSINNTINTLLLILGIITITIIISSIVSSTIKINNNYKFIYGILEITQGLKYLSLSNININIKAIISCFLISFGGICIHMQVFSIIDNKKIRYLPYLIFRTTQASLSCLICSIFIYLIN